MTPMDELTRLNRLIRQFKTVSHSTPDPEQRARVEAETQDFQSYREQIVAESLKGPRPRRGAADSADFPVLSSAEAYCDSLTGDRDAPGGTIAELEDFTSEAVAFLDIPDTNTQENRRADRY